MASSFSILKTIMSIVPPSVMPYLELCRIVKPTGIFNIYFPYLFGFLFAAKVNQLDYQTVLIQSSLLFVFALFLRGSGCSWNDIVDRDLDRLVERCRTRPMARGAISVTNAYLFTAAQTIAWFYILSIMLPMHWHLSIPLTAGVVIYPYGKRFTNYAQLILGLTLSWGVIIGSAVAGIDFSFDGSGNPVVQQGLIFLFGSYVIWCMIHDTVYAQQDVKDDMKAGLKSMAVLWQNHLKALLIGMGLAQVCLLSLAGMSIGSHWVYHLIASCGCGAVIVQMVVSLDLKDARSCASWFSKGCLAVGGLVSGGLAANLLLR